MKKILLIIALIAAGLFAVRAIYISRLQPSSETDAGEQAGIIAAKIPSSEEPPSAKPSMSPSGETANTGGITEPGDAGDALGEPLQILPDYQYINPEGDTVSTRINPPEGFTRVETGGFGEFLRAYPLLEDGAPVLMHDGSKKWNQSDHVAVFDMNLVQGDLQQCADSCIRLYAEYFYQIGAYEKIAFHLVNGFLVDFDTWRNGGRVTVNGNQTEWVMSAEPSDSQETFEKYLRFVFTYASTLSMDRESEPTGIDQIRAGDLFLKGGSPGHVVMVLDVCENETGEKAFLLGQGYMPAQQFHILKNPDHEENPWYYVSEVAYPFVTPEYVFGENSLQRPVYDN